MVFPPWGLFGVPFTVFVGYNSRHGTETLPPLRWGALFRHGYRQESASYCVPFVLGGRAAVPLGCRCGEALECGAAVTLYRGLGSTTNYTSTVQALTPTYCPSCPPSLPLAVMQAESSGNQSAVSPAGAIGLFQLLPSTAAGLSVNPSDPTQNIQGGLTYLQQLYNQFGSWNLALEAYNEGPGALQAQIAAGTTPVSAGYASGILSAAGIDDSSDSSDSSISDATSSLFDFSAITDLPDTTGLSWGTLALIGVALLGAAWVAS